MAAMAGEPAFAVTVDEQQVKDTAANLSVYNWGIREQQISRLNEWPSLAAAWLTWRPP